MKVLVVNAGSSSLKYQLFDTATESVLAKGICERIGIDGRIEHRKGENGEKMKVEIPMKDHAVATEVVIKYLTDPEVGVISDMNEIEGVGHRIVHGGPYFFESVLLNDEVLDKLELCRDFAPLHTGPHIMGIKGCLAVMPDKPQVLVFDTAFHQTMPPQAYMYGISWDMYEKYHIRRYGAHGTSHRFVAREMAKLLDKPLEETKIVTCHIGNGASISAVKGGKCIDTSMGFTPLDGVIMGTRCGSIDPAIVPYIMEKEGYTPAEMSEYMNKKCGFLGISGISSDSRDIEAAILEGNERAYIAASTLAYQCKKYIGSYAAAMNGLDAVVWTAGMGENNPELRDRACADMEYYGIKIDRELNAKTHHQPNTVELSTPDSKVKVYVLPTNEELMIASDTEEIVNKLKK
ncbi:MAG: acetate kinase [Ruminococcaceae bacterium]|jgi:acetate kinase|nr:acetate kinase [Oscillospiraceae bacterium]